MFLFSCINIINIYSGNIVTKLISSCVRILVFAKQRAKEEGQRGREKDDKGEEEDSYHYDGYLRASKLHLSKQGAQDRENHTQDQEAVITHERDSVDAAG